MNWEAVTAVATILTCIVIAITAFTALREVEQLRKATEFEGALEVFRELDLPIQVAARRFVQFELAQRMEDPKFRAEVALLGAVDESTHPELTVLRCFERIGFYLKKGCVARDVLLVVASGRVATMWSALTDVLEIHREALGPRVWENFEALYAETLNFMRGRGLDIDTVLERQRRASNWPGANISDAATVERSNRA
ncbi:MAG: hypothetical protein JO092_11140 [Candidatus Eremiobacteraeota bacterium]|nr:hypothetical protein [Candidatus Eremiobacteraeota bacterium]